MGCHTGKIYLDSGLFGGEVDPESNDPRLDSGPPPDTGPPPEVDEDEDGYTVEAGDCDDGDPEVHPGAEENCNGLDDDCDGGVDEDLVHLDWYQDADDDGWGDEESTLSACAQPDGFVAQVGDCNDADAAIYTGAPEACDGVDNDCDGQVDEDATTRFYLDLDHDGYGKDALE